MTKITLDRETFKALASDTRLDILKTLDGKHLGLNDIARVTNLNKATLHEHLAKLNEAGLIKRAEREGHKWVYYRLTWKGESLLHPENAKIVVLFTTTFIALWVGIIQLIWYIQGTVMNLGYNMYTVGEDVILTSKYGIHSEAFFDGSSSPANVQFPQGAPDFFHNLFLNFQNNQYVRNPSGIPLDKNINLVGATDGTAPLTTGEGSRFVVDQSQGVLQAVYQNPVYLYVALGCFVLFTVVLCISLWRLWENRTPKI
jgi:DNA-binding transcriptional ArsR family regulator